MPQIEMYEYPGEGEPDPAMRQALIARVQDSRPSIDALATEIKKQADRLFPGRTPESMFMKLFSEIGELVDDPESASEFADVMIMLLDHAERVGIPISKSIQDKMRVNDKRTWTSNQLGVMRHVK